MDFYKKNSYFFLETKGFTKFPSIVVPYVLASYELAEHPCIWSVNENLQSEK